MLFGATSADDKTIEDGPVDELRLCALNVNSPNPSRAQRIVNWLLATKSNTLVLTEMQPSEGGRHILASLQAEGFTTTCTPGWTGSRYLTAVATRGVKAVPVQPAGFDSRVVVVDLTTDETTVCIVGIYGPANGMTADSSDRRREFQSRLLGLPLRDQQFRTVRATRALKRRWWHRARAGLRCRYPVVPISR